MTREEIRERADRLCSELSTLSDHYPDAMSVARLKSERHFTSIVRATLEEAARAVCPDCSVGVPVHQDPSLSRRVHFDATGDDHSCVASEIHDLIAALDKPTDEAEGQEANNG